jgi:plasmid replication initiation protein
MRWKTMKKKENRLVTQANQVVEASYKLTLAEKRLVLLILTKIDSHPDKPAALPETLIEVCADDVVENFDLPRKEAYEILKDAAGRLAERWVIIDRPDPRNPKLKQTKTRWVSAISYIPDDGKVQLRLAVDILPYLTNLFGEFVSYCISQVAGMSSVYAIRLYELLVQWGSKGEREVEIDWLKKQFGIPASYDRLFDLKRYVIDPAVEQIKTHSNLDVSYTQRKKGRAVVAFIFKFGIKQDTKPKEAPIQRRGRQPTASKPEDQYVKPESQSTAFEPGFVAAKPTPEKLAVILERLAVLAKNPATDPMKQEIHTSS